MTNDWTDGSWDILLTGVVQPRGGPLRWIVEDECRRLRTKRHELSETWPMEFFNALWTRAVLSLLRRRYDAFRVVVYYGEDQSVITEYALRRRPWGSN